MIKYMLIAILLGSIPLSAASASSVAYETVSAGRIFGHVVTVNLMDADTRVSVALARGGVGKSESFKSMVHRTRPSAAITGTFFDTRTFIPTGDIAVFGKIVHKGCIGSALCIDSSNKAAVVPLSVGRKQGWSGYETVLCCGPVLISHGSVAISLQHEGFGGSLYAPATRTAVGITRAGKLVLVAVNRKTSLHAVANLMLHIGVVEALSLDGGSSTGLYANGCFFAAPVRGLTNLLVVYSKSSNYASARTALVPPSLLPKTVEETKTTTATIAAVSAQPVLSLLDYETPLPGEQRLSSER